MKRQRSAGTTRRRSRFRRSSPQLPWCWPRQFQPAHVNTDCQVLLLQQLQNTWSKLIDFLSFSVRICALRFCSSKTTMQPVSALFSRCCRAAVQLERMTRVRGKHRQGCCTFTTTVSACQRNGSARVRSHLISIMTFMRPVNSNARRKPRSLQSHYIPTPEQQRSLLHSRNPYRREVIPQPPPGRSIVGILQNCANNF